MEFPVPFSLPLALNNTDKMGTDQVTQWKSNSELRLTLFLLLLFPPAVATSTTAV